MLEPERIMESRWIKVGNKFVEESLVHWKRLPAEEATWERTEMLKEQFLAVDDLGDKHQLDRPGIDEPRRSSRVPRKNPRFQDFLA
ncbi:hypothetical protein VITISV_013478 [Olea europaea subsp. europaea]|uniref:Chromo domain-containing protein n=1 Tax=Olea europaea subsp. europaea TaxID=158383 RepID=A0A8S0RAR9_OLEEU|nr:hypothetical protein VITISV_013478 [Olea europaea subsp. europaea]